MHTPLLYSPTGLDLKRVKQALERHPYPLNLVTQSDENGPRESPGFGQSSGPCLPALGPPL